MVKTDSVSFLYLLSDITLYNSCNAPATHTLIVTDSNSKFPGKPKRPGKNPSHEYTNTLYNSKFLEAPPKRLGNKKRPKMHEYTLQFYTAGNDAEAPW